MTSWTPALAGLAESNRRAAARVALGPSLWRGGVVGVVAGVLLALVSSWWLGIVVGLVVGAAVAVTFGTVMRAAAVPGALGVLDAHPAEGDQFARVENLLEGLSISTGITEPELAVVEAEGANLAVVGPPGGATVVVTTGLLASLGRVELEGVLAEALGRIRDHDAELAGQVAAFVTRPYLKIGPGDGARGRGRSPLAARRAERLVADLDPQRHLRADLAAAELTRYPPGVRDALVRIGETGSVIPGCGWGAAHLWMCDPLAAVEAGSPEEQFDELFRRHPPLQHRVDLLGEL